MRCSDCHATEDLIRCGARKGAVRYRCRECNRRMCREYYHSEKGNISIKKRLYLNIKENPDKQSARAQVREAIRIGKLLRPVLCVECGLAKRLDAHHTDYAKPLEVVWLCRVCHASVHKSRL